MNTLLRTLLKRAGLYTPARATLEDLKLAPVYFGSAQLEHVRLIHGFATMAQATFLHDAVAALPDSSTIVEVGVWQGRSAIAMALACRGTNKKVYAIDPWADYEEDGQNINVWLANSGLPSLEDSYKRFLKNRAAFRVEPWLEIIRSPSLQAATSWNNGPIAMVFIDAGHEEHEVRADIDAWIPLLGPGGQMVGDDFTLKGVKAALSSYIKDNPGNWVTSPDERTWFLTHFKQKYPNAASVGMLGNGWPTA